MCSGYDTNRIFIYEGGPPKGSHGHPSIQQQPADLSVTKWNTMRTFPGRPRIQHDSLQVVIPGSAAINSNLCLSAYNEKSIDTLLSMYVPCGNVQATTLEGREFVKRFPPLNVQDEALRFATLAIGTVALGRQNNDASLVQQGRKLYSKALIETRKALHNPKRAKSMAVLTIPQILGVYEILFGAELTEQNASNRAQSWLSHAEGEIALLSARGPEAFTEDGPHCLFSNARYRPLIAAVRTRTPSFLNMEIWKTVPWRGRDKTPNDSLLDIMAAVPEILHRVDRWGILSPDTPYHQARDLETVVMCWTLHFQLDEWLTANEDRILTPTEDSTTLIIFPNLEMACLTIRYWVIALLLYSNLDTASRIPVSDGTTTHPNRPHARQFARRIARSVPYFFREEFGITGVTSISFPLGNALLYFGRNSGIDFEYIKVIKTAWSDASLPSAIRDFLVSMRASAGRPVEES